MPKMVLLKLLKLRHNYWFWPSAMTFCAVLLGLVLPYLDAQWGSDWIASVGVIEAMGVDGARAILTTLAGSTLGVAGVAFSVTIVAVSFASSNYGPRLIGNFMGDRKNQIVLGIFVATFVYCITVLSTVHGGAEMSRMTRDAFVPQLSVYLALLLTLAAVGALIAYIHHIPESINIMNLTAEIGDKLQRAIIRMLDTEDRRQREHRDAVDVEPWAGTPPTGDAETTRAEGAGFLQQIDLEGLFAIARKTDTRIVLHRAPGDFLVTGEPIMTAYSGQSGETGAAARMRASYTQGTNRTDLQDLLFLSDQLVEVLGRALSSGVNDPQTAMLCLNWLRAGLAEFARRPPVQPARPDDPVLYRRVAFEDMLNRSFDEMRQYVAGDRTATLHALDVLEDLALTAFCQPMTDACVGQMRKLQGSASKLLDDAVARKEIEARLDRGLQAIAKREP